MMGVSSGLPWVPRKSQAWPVCHRCDHDAVAINARRLPVCGNHRAGAHVEVTARDVVFARELLRTGADLANIAEALGVSRSDLDIALWNNIDQRLGSRPPPMF